MKKTFLVTSLAAIMSVTASAEAAFTTLTDGSYQMTITGGCYQFILNCQDSSLGYALTDNTTENQATAAAFGISAGSGITNDDLMGIIDFSLTGGNISVTSFSQDSYLDSPGGTFYLRATDLTNMGGYIDNTGNMNFDPTGRTALMAAYPYRIGEQEWNRDDSTYRATGVGTGLYEQWTTGISTNRGDNIFAAFEMTGSALVDTGIAGEWIGTLVSAGNMGDAWGSNHDDDPLFSGAMYTELYNVTITSTVPVPAAVWLFGSGLIGLVGLARRKNV